MSERNKIKIEIFALFALTVAGIMLAFAAFFWGWKYTPAYQRLSQKVQPASTPADLGELTTRVESLESIHNQNLKAFEWQLDQKLIILGSIAVFISFVAGFLGYKTYDGLDKTIEQEVRRALDQALYQLDPTNLQIWVISREEKQSLYSPKTKRDEPVRLDAEMERVQERLLLSGLPNIEIIEKPDKKCYRGVTIIPIFNAGMEKQFIEFLKRNKSSLDRERAAFVLYTQTHQVEKETLLAYPNLATANMPATAASMVLTVGRGLKSGKPHKEKEETK